MQNFAELNLSPSTLNAVKHMGFETPTLIQAKSIPELMAGRDVIAQARTGTGKTAAFGIPLIEKLAQITVRGVHGLVLVPTRELCLQVGEQLTKLGHGAKLKVVEVYGGVGYGEQTHKLRSNDPIIVVATPGRLVDHIERGNIRLDAVRMLVLDEADRMLDMGFFPDVERIIKLVAKERVTALFSATVPEPIRRLSQKFLRNPVTVAVEAGPTVVASAVQYRIDLQRSQKTQGLLALLRKETPESAIVFTRTKHLARRLARQLHSQGFPSVALQGNMSQPQRERAMESFREAEVKILVATDIASRGLDVVHVTHVINYDVPVEPEAYVHRVGRTARMGRTGRAFTFVQGDQMRDLAAIERIAGVRLEKFDVGVLPPPVPEGQPLQDDRSEERHQGRGRGPRRGFSQRGGWSEQRPGRARDNTRPQTAAAPQGGYRRGGDWK